MFILAKIRLYAVQLPSEVGSFGTNDATFWCQKVHFFLNRNVRKIIKFLDIWDTIWCQKVNCHWQRPFSHPSKWSIKHSIFLILETPISMVRLRNIDFFDDFSIQNTGNVLFLWTYHQITLAKLFWTPHGLFKIIKFDNRIFLLTFCLFFDDFWVLHDPGFGDLQELFMCSTS